MLPHTASRAVRLTILAVLFAAATGRVVAGEPQITVRLDDGRRGAGTLTAKPDARGLRIRSVAAGVVVESRFAWDTLAEITLDGRTVSAGELREWADHRAWPEAPKGPKIPMPPAPRSADGRSIAMTARTPVAPPQPAAGDAAWRIETLAVSAELAQWNADPYPDGFLVRIAPRDAQGRIVAARGELKLVLRSFRHGEFRRDSYRLEPRPVELAQLTVLLSEADFAHGPAVVRLPLGEGRPELHYHVDRDFNVEPTAVLSAQFGVPTQGYFEAVCPATLRAWDPLVDRLPYFEGRTDLFRLGN
jgi:hypothetical protein